MQYPGHVIKSGESNTSIVTAIAQRLQALHYIVTSPVGVFDAGLKSVIKLFQSQHLDAFGSPLRADGEIGPLTWGILFGVPATAPAGGSRLALAALAQARSQIGVMESPLGSNRGPLVDQYLASTATPPGNFWCMAFVHFCFMKAAAGLGVPNTFPRTAGCLDAWNKSAAFRITKTAVRANPALVVPGAVFILDLGGGFGHTGIVIACNGGALKTIEGNSNSTGSSNGLGVFELNRRNVMDGALKGFILIP